MANEDTVTRRALIGAGMVGAAILASNANAEDKPAEKKGKAGAIRVTADLDNILIDVPAIQRRAIQGDGARAIAR